MEWIFLYIHWIYKNQPTQFIPHPLIILQMVTIFFFYCAANLVLAALFIICNWGRHKQRLHTPYDKFISEYVNDNQYRGFFYLYINHCFRPYMYLYRVFHCVRFSLSRFRTFLFNSHTIILLFVYFIFLSTVDLLRAWFI